jgi:carbamoyltransferase
LVGAFFADWDGGLAVAAGLTASGSAPTALAHAFWGGDISERDAYKALKRADLPTPELGNLSPQGDVLRVAALLAEGKVVGRAVGRMEWGPRALGHRSILARPHDPSINTWLNERLRRSEFMPFAPLVRAEDAPRYFPGLDKVADAARFMTVCLDTTAEFRRLAPAAVHVDGTARPQVLHRNDDPALHALLGEVGARTGCPVLINTSFNLHEEPIVASASDAVKAMQQARLDALWIGPYVSERP